MDSPVARIFGIDSSVIAISIGYTSTEPLKLPVSAFFGELSETPMTIPIDRTLLLNKLRPSNPTEESSGKKRVINAQPKNKKIVSAKPTAGASDRVEIRLQDFAAMMMDAAATDRAWVQDFQDDQMAIPRDLYEVMLAYQRMRRAG
ncbi:MAG: hypothetical protein NTW52_01835 [Planctomycetota bacterium]|nr:hypothetical protein [Planctomycetota bacterium]